MISTPTVDVKITAQNISYYLSKNYKCKKGDILTIQTEDLTKGSHLEIEFICDYCGASFKRVWKDNVTRTSQIIKKDACKNCKKLKIAESNNITYNKNYFFETDEFKEKAKKTCLEKYGVTSYQKTEICQQQKRETCIQKYGVDNPMKDETIKEKLKQTFIERYNVDNPQKNKEIKIKTLLTTQNNKTGPISLQQKYLSKLYNGKVNIVVGNTILADIIIDNIDIEYDGGGHDLAVKMNSISIEEFKSKEMKREMIIRNNGYNIMRIISKKDKLPTDEVLIDILNIAKGWFNEGHSWIYFDIDAGNIINSCNPNGFKYNYGVLRRIKNEE